MGRKQREFVLVLNAEGHFAEYVEPAVARKALREGVVEVVKTSDEFAIQMPTGMSRVPRLFRGRGVKQMSLDRFSQLFSEEQPLYVKTLVPGQVSFEISVGPGMTEPVLVPHSGDPVCLTDVAPFDALKRCMDLRKLAKPRKTRSGGLKPPAIRIMTEDEVRGHYEAKAVRLGYTDDEGNPDVERAAAPIYTEAAVTQPATRVDLPPKESERAAEEGGGDANLGDKPVMINEVVHPRVLGLCNDLTADAPENQRPSADSVLTELDSLGALNVETLNHLLSFGYYKTVKTWAQQQLLAQVAAEE